MDNSAFLLHEMLKVHIMTLKVLNESLTLRLNFGSRAIRRIIPINLASEQTL